jgi:hypothetical protein
VDVSSKQDAITALIEHTALNDYGMTVGCRRMHVAPYEDDEPFEPYDVYEIRHRYGLLGLRVLTLDADTFDVVNEPRARELVRFVLEPWLS